MSITSLLAICAFSFLFTALWDRIFNNNSAFAAVAQQALITAFFVMLFDMMAMIMGLDKALWDELVLAAFMAYVGPLNVSGGDFSASVDQHGGD